MGFMRSILPFLMYTLGVITTLYVGKGAWVGVFVVALGQMLFHRRGNYFHGGKS